jgi:hypothetical protein
MRIPAITLTLGLVLATAVAAQPLPAASPESEGFSAERIARVHAMLKGHVDSGRHAGVVSLIVRRGKIVDWETYGSRDRRGAPDGEGHHRAPLLDVQGHLQCRGDDPA